MRAWLQPLMQLVLPERCRLCHIHLQEPDRGLCASCLERIDYLGASVCCRCGTPLASGLSPGFFCGRCIRHPPPWDQAVSLVRYGPQIQKLLLRLKYQADTTVVPALETIVRPVRPLANRRWDHLVPVPLHPSRLRARGMNQALSMAMLLFPDQHRAITQDLLLRTRATVPQTGLDGSARRRNLRGAFQIGSRHQVRGMRVCLIDDVFTTGSTVWECARVLRRAGAAEVAVFTLARVVMGDQRPLS
ncbi:MAG: ComF family protein [Desulfopila sp.]